MPGWFPISIPPPPPMPPTQPSFRDFCRNIMHVEPRRDAENMAFRRVYDLVCNDIRHDQLKDRSFYVDQVDRILDRLQDPTREDSAVTSSVREMTARERFMASSARNSNPEMTAHEVEQRRAEQEFRLYGRSPLAQSFEDLYATLDLHGVSRRLLRCEWPNESVALQDPHFDGYEKRKLKEYTDIAFEKIENILPKDLLPAAVQIPKEDVDARIASYLETT